MNPSFPIENKIKGLFNEGISEHFQQDKYGIWHSKLQSKTLSYPDNGHDSCMSIEDDSLWFRHRNQCIAEALSAYPPTGALFDIGGGNGVVSSHLQQRGICSILVEPGKTGAFNARTQRNLPIVICGSSAELSFLAGSISAIGLFDVLEHIEDDVGFLDELHTLLRPDGRIYLTVPAHAWLWSNADVRAMHYRRYTLKTLRLVLEKAGFTIEYHTGIFAPLIPAIFFLRSLLSCWGRTKQKQRKTERIQKEHGTSHGPAWHYLMQLLKRDIRMIQRKKSTWGASLLCVASKTNNSTRKDTTG